MPAVGRDTAADGSRFDALTKSLSVPGTRRRLIGALAAGMLGMVGLRRSDAAACRPVGTICREHANCCSGLCGPNDATGRRRCACRADGDCPPPAVCHAVACQNGDCAVSIVADGTPCSLRGGGQGTCKGGACVAPTTTTSTTTSTTTTAAPPSICPTGGDFCSTTTFCNHDECACATHYGPGGDFACVENGTCNSADDVCQNDDDCTRILGVSGFACVDATSCGNCPANRACLHRC